MIRLPVRSCLLHLLAVAGTLAAPLAPAAIEARIARHDRVKAQIEELEGATRTSPSFARYEDEYEAAVAGLKGRPAERATLATRLEAAHLVLVGDLHLAPASQDLSAALLEAMARGDGPLAVALEWIDRRHQAKVDAYLAGRLDAAKLKAAIGFDKTWGFSWASHRRLLEAIKAAGAAVVLAEDFRDDEGLGARDRDLTTRLAAHAAAHPGTRYLVPYGTYHVLGKGHLAERLAAALGSPATVVLTAADEVYWAALRRYRDPDRLATLDLGRDRFLVPAGDPLEQALAYRRYLLDLTGLELDELDSTRFDALHRE